LRKARRKTQTPPRPRVTARTNEEIRVQQIRLVDETGRQAGVMSVADAIEYARSRELDVVEVAPEADPPVCRVLDYGKWRYEEERARRAHVRNQIHVSPKEVRLRPRIAEHDYEWKRNRAAQFLQARSKVRLVMLFRGREREHVDMGKRLLERLALDVQELGHVEGSPTFEGRSLTMLLAPNGSDSSSPA
jgi:translation initiation factor IF-3